MSAAHPAVKLALAMDFLTAQARLPRRQQEKVLAFIGKFRENPAAPGIHYEKIHDAADPRLRSVRIDDAYRGIVFKPEAGNVYILLWVDHHDAAYQWAARRQCLIHPETGSVQIIDTAPVLPAPAADEAAPPDGLFAQVRDRQLLKLGVPQALLPLVRGLKTEDDLDNAAGRLPGEAHDALVLLAAGCTVEETLRELDRTPPPAAVDTADYAAALERPESLRRFYVVEDELELLEVLQAPLERWRVFLHPSQRRLVMRDWSGPVRVLGGAGTGKTVAALHRAKWLARHRLAGEGERILFTTFTRNLAADIRDNLGRICAGELLARIDVVNLDRWVVDFLRRRGYRYEIAYGRRARPCWEQALALAPREPALAAAFYREEWERIIQPQGVAGLAEYLAAPRTGRGVRLNRKERMLVWPVFEEYRLLLDEAGLREPDDAMRDARQLLEQQGDVLPYRAVIVDEAQDMGPQAFRLIRQIAAGGDRPNALFIVGDAHQRIYRHKVVLSQCGINVRGRSRRLLINYRTTEETRRWAVGLLEGLPIDDLDGGLDARQGYKSLLHGAAPLVREFPTLHAEVDFLADYLRQVQARDGSLAETCLVARTDDLLALYEGALAERGLAVCRISRDKAEDRRQPGVRLATMHRVKGLEFDRVVIAAVNDGVVPLHAAIGGTHDPLLQRESEIRERALLYVAATRARREVVVTSHGEASRFLRP